MSLDVVVTNYDETLLTRSSPSGYNSQHHLGDHQSSSQSGHHGQPHVVKKYQYAPYKSSLSASKQSVGFGYQKLLPGQHTSPVHNSRSQYLGFSSQDTEVQRENPSGLQQQLSSSGPHFESRTRPVVQSQKKTHRQFSLTPQPSYYPRDDYEVRCSSLKRGDRRCKAGYGEMLDSHYQFRSQRSMLNGDHQWGMSSSSSEGSTQESAQHPEQSLLQSSQYNPQHPRHYTPPHQQQQYSRNLDPHRDPQLHHALQNGGQCQNDDVEDEPIHMDLYELQQARAKHLASTSGRQHVASSKQHVESSKQHVESSRQHVESSRQHVESRRHVESSRQHVENGFIPPRSNSRRHTFVKPESHVSHRVSCSDSFSFASTIKCCVGAQTKKKKKRQHHGRTMVSYSNSQAKCRSLERNTKLTSDCWRDTSSVRNADIPSSRSHSSCNSPTHSISMSTHTHRTSHNYSSGYSSEVDSLRSTLAGEAGEAREVESDSDLSDSDFSRAAAGSRGKSAGSVMMKLAKKFSKKNFLIVRDDGCIEAIGEEEVRKIKTHSTSVSDLDSLGRFRHRSLSLEHLDISGKDKGRPGSSDVSNTSPSLVRTWSKVGNKKNMEQDSESTVSTNLYRVGSKKNLVGIPSEVLFEAIEQGNVEAVASLIDSTLITKFNMVNDDDLLPVDLSAMLGQHSITRLLLGKAAKDSSKFCRDPYLRLAHIKALMKDADQEIYRLQEESTSLNVANSNNGGGIGNSGSGVKELEKRFKKAERRSHLFSIMFSNYEKAGVPGPPTNVKLHVTSNRSLMVIFSEPEDVNLATITRYKIEWCRNDDFNLVAGDFVMTDLRATEYVIPDLDQGQKYYVRVSAYNMKGFGCTKVSCPAYACPSCWHDLDCSKPRYEGCTDSIHLIAAQFGLSVQGSDGTHQQSGLSISANSSLIGRTRTVKKTNPLSRRFTSAVKFQRSLKAGVYIASLFYSDESKLLITTDDQIPIIEVADAAGTAIGQDFVWLANLACTWEHVQAMSDITDNYTSSPGVQFRNLLLHAVLDLQNALGVTDLGLLHPLPYKDSQGAIVFVIVQYTSETKSVASGNSSLKWTDVPRLWKKRGTPSRTVDLDVIPVPDQLVMDAQELMSHHCSSIKPMSKGLYLGYLRARSSVASMKVICPRDHPSVLPHLKIRSNPNISSDEWEWLKSLQSSSCPPSLHSSCPQSLQQSLLPTLHLFLASLGLSQEEAALHQLYVHEAIELNEDITVLLVLPPSEEVCTAPGSMDHFIGRPQFVALPISTFEIMQLYTYQRSFMTKFSMVRARVDVELLVSLHKLREAFSKEEVTEAKEKKSMLEGFHSRTDQVWKQMRWLEDAVQKGRNHQANTHTLLHVASIIKNVEEQRREVEETEKKEDVILYSSELGQGSQHIMQEGTTMAKRVSGGHLRVILSYCTGLVRGSIVKLYVESTTTSVEVIRLVVNQVAVTTRTPLEEDLTDYYLVAGIRDKKEWILEKNYHPLQLQMNAADQTKDKIFLMVKRRSEEEQLNQMVTNV